MNTRKKISLIVCFISIAATIFLWVIVLSHQKKELTVSFLNVGQGDAIFIESPTGRQVLVDAGPDVSVLRELGSQMHWYDKSIDMLIATHPDRDHIAGFPYIIDRYNVSYFVEPGAQNENGVQDVLNQKVLDHHLTKIIARRGMVFDIGGGVTISILYPDRDVSHVPSNDGSIVMKLTYGEDSFILTGDAPTETEAKILSRDSKTIRAQVLKLGHHGSRTSTSPLFLQAIHPTYAIVSAGVNNRYGHPHQEVIDMVKKFGATIFTTQKSGTIRFRSDGVTLTTNASSPL